MAAGGGRVQRAHAVEGAQVHVGAAVLLTRNFCQVQVAHPGRPGTAGRGAAARPPVHAAAGEAGLPGALGRGSRGAAPDLGPDLGECRHLALCGPHYPPSLCAPQGIQLPQLALKLCAPPGLAGRGLLLG